MQQKNLLKKRQSDIKIHILQILRYLQSDFLTGYTVLQTVSYSNWFIG